MSFTPAALEEASLVVKTIVGVDKPPGEGPYRRQRRRVNPAGSFEKSPTLRNHWSRKVRKARVKRVSWRDEEIAGMSLAVTVGPESTPMEPEIIDPAILAVSVEGRTTRQYQYTREKLLELRDAPHSRRRPDYLDPIHNNSQGYWDPERWHHDWKRSETPNDGSSQPPPENHKRRSGDPRERLRKEQDGIVLSPQRRSFNSGCFVPVTQQPNRSGRPDSPLGKPDPHLGHREISQTARRIGSGRIIARDVSWDYRPDKPELDGPQEFFSRSGTRERKDTDRDERYERRSFGRDYERDKDRHVSRNGRYDRRRISDSKDEEPEWFSGGPTSQHDTIELRGFDDPAGGDTDRSASSQNGRKKQSPSRKKRNRERAITKTNNDSTTSKEESPKGPGARSTPTPQEGMGPCGPGPHSPIKEEMPGSEMDDKSDAPTDMSTTSVEQPLSHPPMDFNIDDFLKMDTIPEQLLTNGVGSEIGSTAGSRFSRWFNKETSPVQNQDSRRSSLQGDHLVNNIINDMNESANIVIPNLGESDTYFAPISPAASTGGSAPGAQGSGPAPGAKPVTLLEMLQRGKQPIKQPTVADVPPVMKNMDVPGKVLSLEELEARMRKGNDASVLNRSKQDEDMSAFKRLLAQVSGGQAVPASNGPIGQGKQQPMSLLQMLSKSQQEDATRAAAGLLGPQSPGTASGPHVPNDLVLKLHQVQQHQRQQEMLSKLMNNSNSGAAPHRQQSFGGLQTHPQEMQAIGAPSRELLQRPEAVAILQGLKRGDITPQHLIQQLAANPAMQPRHRELLMTILKQSSVGPSPRVLSPVPPPPQHMLFQQQQQQLRVSPLPPNAYCVSPILATSPNTLTVHHPAMQQRIPSPRELQAHTQGIMQRALIKKKLEEQQENFRRKQELQQQQQQRSRSPSSNSGGAGGASPAKHMASPTPLAFTPTSVLRKMTAEKEGEPPLSKDNNNKSSATNENQNKQPHGRPVMGMRPPPVQQSQPLQPQNWNMNQPIKQPVGRPIVKGANSSFQFSGVQEFQMQMTQQRNMFQQAQQRAKLGVQNQPQQYNLQNRVVLHQQGQINRNHLQAAQRGSNSWHHLLMGQNYDIPMSGRGGMQLGRGGSPGDGDLSPTSDQLARWFSPELLAQARAGKLPDMPPAGIAQNALSLEELERIQQNTAPVHN